MTTPQSGLERKGVTSVTSVATESWSPARVGRDAAPLSKEVEVGDLRLNPEARLASLREEPLQLTAVEFDLLLSLARAAGRVKTREQLLLEVADRNFDVFDRSVDVHISSLRRKLGDDPRAPRFITTIRSAGYMMRKPGSNDVT